MVIEEELVSDIALGIMMGAILLAVIAISVKVGRELALAFLDERIGAAITEHEKEHEPFIY